MGGRGSASTLNASRVAERVSAYRVSVIRQEDKIRNNDYETAALIDQNGKVIFTESQGSPDEVNFTAEQCRKMKGRILTHNHPNGSVFSDADIDLLVSCKLAVIRATSANVTYQLQAEPGIFISRRTFAKDYLKVLDANDAAAIPKADSLHNAYKNGRITRTEYIKRLDELEQEVWKQDSDWMMKNARKYGYRYSVIGGK